MNEIPKVLKSLAINSKRMEDAILNANPSAFNDSQRKWLEGIKIKYSECFETLEKIRVNDI